MGQKSQIQGSCGSAYPRTRNLGQFPDLNRRRDRDISGVISGTSSSDVDNIRINNRKSGEPEDSDAVGVKGRQPVRTTHRQEEKREEG
ncbi:UNVERIFIED_CONTAM: hypothetical protein PYX00_000733 [Menopon gallinae]|uniref:Uncharacterized protein n=1 Tax=Menopon gallinae TaxID=328185 RepID=A0AAW2IBI1_9NEOP